MKDGLIDTLAGAQRIVDAADLAPDLRPVAFRRVLESTELASPAKDEASSTARARDAAGDPLVALASRIGADHGAVETVFYVDDDGRLALGLPASRLGRRTAETARRIALLVALARQFDGNEQFTASSAIRTICQDFGAFDTGNFSKTLLAMSDVFQFQGSGSSRRVRLTRPGYEEASRLVQELGS